MKREFGISNKNTFHEETLGQRRKRKILGKRKKCKVKKEKGENH